LGDNIQAIDKTWLSGSSQYFRYGNCHLLSAYWLVLTFFKVEKDTKQAYGITWKAAVKSPMQLFNLEAKGTSFSWCVLSSSDFHVRTVALIMALV
jgi:hypothetical protein